jgi:gliding motility-associated-like protein
MVRGFNYLCPQIIKHPNTNYLNQKSTLVKLPLLILITFISSMGFSQGEANHWYFGNNTGIDFDSGNPTTVQTGQLNTIEGCTSISSAAGALLFYTNGHTVWNKNHQVMANGTGLYGDLSSSQAAVVVKKPESNSIYYIITTNPFDDSGGLRYSEVDMSQGNGMGTVTNKNVLLYQNTTEKIAIVNSANGEDVWAVTHVYGSDEFRAFLITENGISASSVSSNTGLVVSSDDDHANAIGYMKISPDGKKLAICHTYLTKAELFDFDPSTGIVSNPVVISNEGLHVYGAEFATNSDVLYISSVDEMKLFQYDLTSDDIQGSRIMLGQLPATLGALQLGPNGKIYVAMAETNQLSVIANPDTVGNCNLQINSIYLDGMCMLGLPSFNASFFDDTIKIQNTCAASPSTFTVSTGQNIQSVTWDFGDNTTSTELNPSHIYATGGEYIVTATVSNSNCNIIKSKKFTIAPAPEAHEIADQALCIASGEVYHLTQNNAAILNGQSTSDFSIAYYISLADAQTNSNAVVDYTLQPGTVTFYASVTNIITGCSAITNFSVSASLMPGAVIPGDYTICEDYPYDGSESFDLTLKNVEILGGQDSNVFHVQYFHSQNDAEANLNPISSPYTNTLAEETLYARVSNVDEVCYLIVPLQLRVIQNPKATPISDYVICDNGPYDGFADFDLETKNTEALGSLPASGYVVTYYTQLSDAENNVAAISGLYTNTVLWQTVYARVESIHGGCAVITPFHLDVKECEQAPPAAVQFGYPKFFSPNGDNINDSWQIVCSNPSEIIITIFDRNGKMIKRMSGSEPGWDGTLNGHDMPPSDYWFIVTAKAKEYKGHFSLLR